MCRLCDVQHCRSLRFGFCTSGLCTFALALQFREISGLLILYDRHLVICRPWALSDCSHVSCQFDSQFPETELPFEWHSHQVTVSDWDLTRCGLDHYIIICIDTPVIQTRCGLDHYIQTRCGLDHVGKYVDIIELESMFKQISAESYWHKGTGPSGLQKEAACRQRYFGSRSWQ